MANFLAVDTSGNHLAVVAVKNGIEYEEDRESATQLQDA